MDCYSWDEFLCEATDWLGKEVAGGLTTLAFVKLLEKAKNSVISALPSDQRAFAEEILEDAEEGDDSSIYYSCIENPEIVAELIAELD